MTLMPKGYPETVTPNYTLYVQWTAVGLLTGRVQAVLATQASLFAVGLGPIPWLIVSEMFPTELVTNAQAVASQLNWACAFVVGLGFHRENGLCRFTLLLLSRRYSDGKAAWRTTVSAFEVK